MKKTTKIIFAIVVVLWTIGAVLVYKKDSPNVGIIVTALIAVIGFVTQMRKKVKNGG